MSVAVKRARTRFWPCCIAAACVTACNTDQEADGTRFEFVREGGIAGFSQRIVVDGQGTATVTNLGESRDAELAGGELERIAELIESVDTPDFTDAPPRRSTECCDLVYYYVAVQGRYLDLSTVPAETRDAIIQVLEPLLAPSPTP